MQATLIQHEAAGFIAFLSLLALSYIIDRLGLMAWFAWLNRRQSKPREDAGEPYRRVHP
ncbi:MAG: hypothetical protein ABSD75_14290 [Terriglobales bacterium]|jgi:hypothetical protein